MRFRKAGKIADNLWYLGREESGTYCLEGKNGTVMINGGLSYILPDVLGQMKELGLDPAKVTKFLILHSHFDHVGIVPYFKRTYPKIEVLASAAAWNIFANPKYVAVMNSFGRLSAKQAGVEEKLTGYDIDWRDDMTGTTVSEGSRIDLGGISLDILETPGHTHCSVTAYEPNLKALFPTDAAGIPYRDLVFPSMNTNANQYLESLEKMKPLPVSIFCADHYGFIIGEEAGTIVAQTIREGRKWKTYLEEYYRKHGGDIDAASKSINEFFYKEFPGYFIAPDILEGVFKQMFKFIAKTMQ
ncbi:MAG TPA: MBL fold metallo-hydrolase [Syntrophales bacterium]|jgi:glyoxylase-like metal-dependent hydrolase (beta-lactamase superfamily II)|nr:MBL fold metallo-hydrolase [Syntrophales bacterium]HOX94802.1 MBL fold metallo-hydrolase [Syntrophales bacterium]HPI56717.1 MBL fold metallo-hydrolase [Syntrophales bacterium]HPN24858.1 MBL fold metallo-hydrolase [Syntrophales bacterium]HQM30293.1 MBL fold metallo-hydrolase [Syntrophales bacterium]